MISYCPLEPEEAPSPPRAAQSLVRRPQAPPQQQSGTEDTECNYLVLFFILGVMILAASDSVSIRR